ncbi:MAG: FTR1 family protein [Pseudomonadota bacterium]|jgi:high-affinity iron transporter
MLATLILVFREVMEAGLIVGIVLAAARGVAGRGLWVGAGVAGGVIGSGLVALFASAISNAFAGSGQELLNAAILGLAVLMLAWHNIWMASHGRELAHDMKSMGGAVAEGRRPLTALAIVVGVAVLREGSELVLFLYGVAASGGTSQTAMLIGSALGLAAGVGLTAATYAGLTAIPAHRLFAVTGGIITLVAAGLAAQAVGYLQAAGWLNGWTTPLWDTSALLSQNESTLGRALHTIVGYMDQPNAAELVAYLTVAAAMIGARRWVDSRHATPTRATAAAES